MDFPIFTTSRVFVMALHINCTFLYVTLKTSNFFFINATPMRQYLKRTVFKQNVLNKTSESEEIFHLSSTQYSVFTEHCALQ